MAKNEKKISISTVDKIMKEQFNNASSAQWNGVEVKLKHSISFPEMLEFVNDVVMSCFQEDGGFMPEVMDFAIKSNILTRYANFSMPDNLEHRYEIIYKTDAVDFVCQNINSVQLNEIVTSINRKINHLCNSNAMSIQAKMNELIAAFENIQKQTAGVFENLNPDDIVKLAGAIGAGGVTEDKIVAAYLQQTKPAPAEQEEYT